MKTCFTSKEIDHIWVHRKAVNGRVSGGNESFQDDRFFSYSTCIAERRTFKGLGDVYFVSRDSYSNTTAGHISGVRGAIGQQRIVYVSGVSRGSDRILPYDKLQLKKWARNEIDAMYELAGEAAATAKRARTRGAWHTERAKELLEDAKFLASLFKVKFRACDDVEKLAQVIEERHKKEAAERKRLRLAAEKARAEQLSKWLAGENVPYPSNTYDLDREVFGTRLRVVERPDQNNDGAVIKIIETSLGIKIDYAEAHAALRWLLSHREKGWRTNGEKFKIAGWDVSSVSETGVVAGCHRVRWDEIERIAKQEGWLK